MVKKICLWLLIAAASLSAADFVWQGRENADRFEVTVTVPDKGYIYGNSIVFTGGRAFEAPEMSRDADGNAILPAGDWKWLFPPVGSLEVSYQGCIDGVYVIFCHYFDHIVVQNFLPAIFATVYAEVMARIVKAPATPILACSIISLVPGGKLYYTMYYFVTSDSLRADISLNETLQIAAGLAVGIICVSVIVHELNRHKAKKILEID